MIARGLAASAFAACLAMSCAYAAAAQAQDMTGGAGKHPDEPALLVAPEFQPTHLFAPPPPRNSTIEALEMQRLRALRAAASPERIAQAERDSDNHDPGMFSAAAGRDLDKLPATSALLKRVEHETERLVTLAKDYFKRLRPYGVDPQIPHCGNGKVVDRSYPSGHAGFGWSTGWTLARLMPERAPELIARAQDYELSREICGVHFPSDLEASHAAAMLIADRLLADPRLADQVAAARRELAQP